LRPDPFFPAAFDFELDFALDFAPPS